MLALLSFLFLVYIYIHIILDCIRNAMIGILCFFPNAMIVSCMNVQEACDRMLSFYCSLRL